MLKPAAPGVYSPLQQIWFSYFSCSFFWLTSILALYTNRYMYILFCWNPLYVASFSPSLFLLSFIVRELLAIFFYYADCVCLYIDSLGNSMLFHIWFNLLCSSTCTYVCYKQIALYIFFILLNST